jgi:hypothetical protein
MINVTAGRYVLGVAATLIVLASLGSTAVSLRHRYLPDWTGARARLAEVIIALATLTGLLELLGLIGLFRLGPIVLACVLVALAIGQSVGWPRGARTRAARAGAAEPSQRWFKLAALVVAGAVVAEWAGPTLESYDVGIRTLDSTWYHLPWAASFVQSGFITPLHFTDVEYLTAFYPATSELYHGLGIVLFGRDTLSPGVNLLWLGLVLLAAYCVGEPRNRGWLTLSAAALAMATPAIGLSQAGSAANDVVGVFFVLAAAALLAQGDQRRAPLLLAGVSAGLAVSVKLSMLAPVLALSVVAVALSPAGRRRAGALTWFGAVLATGGFWYLRNLIAVGNPLPWLSLPGLSAPAPALQQHTGFSVAHYLTDSHVISSVFGPGLSAGLGPWWPVLLAAVVLGPLLCLVPGDRREVRWLGLAALASTIAYLITPETAAGPAGQPLGFAFNLRYGAPALTLSLGAFALAPGLAGPRRQAAAFGGLGLVLVATLAQARLWPSDYLAGEVGAGLAVLAIGLLIEFGAPRLSRDRGRARLPGRRARRVAMAVSLAILLAAGTAAGYAWQRHYLRGRYAFHPGVSYMARVWSLFRQVHDARVGVVGTFGGFVSYPLFGVDDSNRVGYVAARGPHGSFTTIGTCAGWRAAVNAGGYRYLVTTPSRDPWHPKRLGPSPEERWTASDPAARLLYTRRALGRPISVYELTGRLDPAACR